MPLAVALLSISNPTVSTMDMLSRLSHDSDQEVAQNAVISLGATPVHPSLSLTLGGSYAQSVFLLNSLRLWISVRPIPNVLGLFREGWIPSIWS